ncbi:hypothetical protein MMC34_008506 [Xylographa carneopallida]|nr:hypothetical protein [Xylographa carneopallida]
MSSAGPDLERRYAALRAKKAAAAGSDAATAAPSKSASTSSATGLPLISPHILHSTGGVPSKPVISITPKSLAQPASASSAHPASAGNKRQKTNTAQIVINAPSPYGEQSDTIKRKKRPGATQTPAAATASASTTHSGQLATIRIAPPAALAASSAATSARIPRTGGASNAQSAVDDKTTAARSDIDLSSTSHLASYTPAAPTFSNDTLHVSNLPDAVTEAQLHSLFSPFGVLSSVTLLATRIPPLAFVHFAFPNSAQQALTALHDRPALSLSPLPLSVQFARKKDAGSRGGSAGGNAPISTYEALERELADGGSAKAAGGSAAGDLEDGESFDLTLLAWKPEAARVMGLTAERAVKTRRRCIHLGESMQEATEGMYVLPTEEDAMQPDRDPIDYDDLSTPYS